MILRAVDYELSEDETWKLKTRLIVSWKFIFPCSSPPKIIVEPLSLNVKGKLQII